MGKKRDRNGKERKGRGKQRAPTAKERKQLEKDRKMATGFLRDREKTGQLIEAAMQKADRNRGVLEKVWNDLMTLFRLVRAWVTREYTEVPWKTLLWILGAIVYFVNPFDVIPDFIPVFGYVDDAAVIAFVINSVRNDVEDFKDWEQSKG